MKRNDCVGDSRPILSLQGQERNNNQIIYLKTWADQRKRNRLTSLNQREIKIFFFKLKMEGPGGIWSRWVVKRLQILGTEKHQFKFHYQL